MGNRIELVRGTSRTFEIPIETDDGRVLTADDLVGSVAEVEVRESPTDSELADVMHFTSPDTDHLVIDGAVIRLSFIPTDSESLELKPYYYQVVLTLADGTRSAVIEWDVVDVTLGGVAETPPPTFDATVKIDHNYEVVDSLRYMTPGGSPIESAQIRVYYKSDYDAGRLSAPVGVSLTDAYGRWANPVLVLPGFSYVVQFMKPNEFGPDKAEIVV